jgi:taurine dioxygenase
MAPLTVSPLTGAGFGAEIVGLDPDRITAGDEERIHRAYREGHGLLCFSFDRLLEADELHALTAVFGENEFAPGYITGIGRGAADGAEPLDVDQQADRLRAEGVDPYLAFIGNLDPTTLEPQPVSARFYGEWEWHSDMSYIEVPPTFSLLHARTIPDESGDTGFCSQVMAAAALPADLRRRVVGRDIKHDSTYTSAGVLRPGMTVPASPVDALGHAHPILRKVPTTGEEALFLGRRTNGYVVGLSLDESEALLDELWAHATRERFCYRHRWRVGQVVVWDNRMLLHKRYPVDDGQARLMWRTQTRGEAVIRA